MAKLKVWTEGSEIHVRAECNARACSETLEEIYDIDEAISLLDREGKTAQKHMAKQAFRMMAAKMDLNLEPEPTEIDVPLFCRKCEAWIDENPRPVGEDGDV